MKDEGTWLLVIYSVPAEPSRKRAAVWRDLKKAGALYLRDGVGVLPERPAAEAAFRALAARVEEFGGEVVVVRSARLEQAETEALIGRFRAARTAEYQEVAGEAARFRQCLRQEAEHRQLSRAELATWEQDLDKLRRWSVQIAARDYFGVAEAARVEACLANCRQDLAALAEDAGRVAR